MGIFSKKKTEERAEVVGFGDSLLTALIGTGTATKEMALAIPTVSGAIDLVANVVASTPVKLYRDENGKAVEVTDDPRLKLLNDETGDTLTANEFWRAMIRDYYTGKGGYAYIDKSRGRWRGLFYVDEKHISIQRNTDPIFKEFNLMVNGQTYRPYDFIRILRNTTDGMEGQPITKENSKLIEVAYATMILEKNMARRGGNKKGFLKSEKRIEGDALKALREGFSRLYNNDGESSDNFLVLNNGIEFKESSNTAVELQLNENKESNAEEFARIFHVSTRVLDGSAGEGETSAMAKLAAIPLMVTIECALNRDFLLEKEKGTFYWAFDKRELMRGTTKERFEAYKTALDANFMQIDEVRYAEDMEPLGLSWIKLGLQDVLYDPKTKQLFTPNTGRMSALSEISLQDDSEDDMMQVESDDDMDQEVRGNGQYHTRNGKGQFNGSTKALYSKSEVNRRLVGKKTGDGIVITSVHPHAFDRINGKEVSIENVIQAMKAKGTKGNKNGRLVYKGKRNSVIVGTNKDERGTIITVIFTG